MAYGIVHFFPGGTKEQYDAAVAALHPAGDVLPEGQIFHCAGPSAGGWTVVVIYNSKANWEHFRDGTLLPGFGKGIKGGFGSPPQETAFDVHKLLP